jgi:hypothetical protein
VWRAVQSRINRPWNTPAVDWELGGRHAKNMADWAQKEGRVMIAGHTHLPVFWSREGVQKDKPEIRPDEVEAVTDRDNPDEAEALRLARVAWAKAEQERIRHQGPRPNLKSPCYFNTGCCSFGDGDITGIEIGRGWIQLIHWESKPDVQPRTLGKALPLGGAEGVFELVREARRDG